MAQITTVIPTYRRPRLLRRAIRSVLAQTCPDFEVHVWDNASGDETADVVAEIARRDPRVHYHCHPENIGPVRNFANGAAQVATPLLNFLSDDDLLLPKFFETATSAFERYPQAMMFVGETIEATREDSTPTNRKVAWREGLYEPPSGLFEWLRSSLMWTGMIFKRSALEGVGGLDIAAGMHGDSDLILRVASRYPVIAADAPCGLFFYGGTSSQSPLKDWVGRHLHTKETIERDPALSRASREWIANALRDWLANTSFRCGVLRSARFGRLDEARAAAEALRQLDYAPSRRRIAELFSDDSIAGGAARIAFGGAYAVRSHLRRLVRRRNGDQLRIFVEQALKACGDDGVKSTRE